MAMAIRTDTLSSTLNSIGISRARGVDLPLLRDQLNGTLPKTGAGSVGNGSVQGSQGSQTDSNKTRYTATRELSPDQQRVVAELKQIDQNVHAHEQAHLAAGHGVVTSSARYTYTYGPDGKQYAVAGEVGIDTSAERKPEANIDKGSRIQAAALAPRDPSPQDYRVAAIGGRLAAEGQVELRQQEVQQQTEQAAKAQAGQAEQAEQAAAPAPSPDAQQQQQQQQQQADSNRQELARAYASPQARTQPVAVNILA